MAKYIGGTTKFMHGNPDGFGKYYTGSNKAKQAKRKRKQLAKQSKKLKK